MYLVVIDPGSFSKQAFQVLTITSARPLLIALNGELSSHVKSDTYNVVTIRIENFRDDESDIFDLKSSNDRFTIGLRLL